MPPLIDAHCHLADSKLRDDLPAVLERARRAGVRRIIAVGAIGTIETDRFTVEIAARHPDIFAAIGVHPHDAKDTNNDRIEELSALARSNNVVAIGETGLDFHYTHSSPGAQELSLGLHLELANKLGLPIVIHCRRAETRLAEIVREVGMPRAGGMIHCFTGNIGAARQFMDFGFYLSFSGILTFKSAAELRQVAQAVPTDRLLVETDAPYLTPEPHRGKLNEPAFVRLTLEMLAHLRQTDPAELIEAVSANAERLFRLN